MFSIIFPGGWIFINRGNYIKGVKTLGFNINSGGLPKEMATIAPNDKVTQDISLGSFNPIGNREGQKH